jgi:hypothetical protein
VRINWFYDELVSLDGPEDVRYCAFETVARDLTTCMRSWMQLPQVSSRISR